jgi:hypothetical protein
MAHLKPISTTCSSDSSASGRQNRRSVRHVLHHEIGRRRLGHRVEDLHNVRVLEPPDQCRLGREEAFLIGRGVGRRAYPLDGDLAVVEVVAREEDLARGALPEPPQHAVLADLRGQRRLGGDVVGDGHGGRRILALLARARCREQAAEDAAFAHYAAAQQRQP